jgi:hypothetical protein
VTRIGSAGSGVSACVSMRVMDSVSVRVMVRVSTVVVMVRG